MESHIDIYLVGTFQKADVMIQKLGVLSSDGYYSELDARDDTVIYEACEDYGMCLVIVSLDGYTYQFVVGGVENMKIFRYEDMDKLSPKYMIEECLVDEVEIPEYVNLNKSAITSNSKTYNPNSGWLNEVGEKFVESLQDQAIDMAAGALLKFIFL